MIERKQLKWHVCPECGSENWIALNSRKAICCDCNWKYEGDIYMDSPVTSTERREIRKRES